MYPTSLTTGLNRLFSGLITSISSKSHRTIHSAAMAKLWIIYLIMIAPLISTAQSLKWLSMASLSASLTAQGDICQQMPGLERRQKKVCKRHQEMMPGVMKGANMSILECQHQFQDRRWNCSMVDENSIFGNVVNQGTREAAYIHAITAAGVSVAVTKGCSRGELPGCGCDQSKVGEERTFTWSGCSDNVMYGSAFSRRFTDARERLKNTNGRSLMNLHNNQAGREIVERNMQMECKCHGVSGSCEVKMCWRSLPPFRKVGYLLKQAFDGATEVKSKKKSSSKRLELMPSNRRYKPYSDNDLVYLKESPDFCTRNTTLGSLGTQGRECKENSKGVDGCDLMCCGRGYRTTIETVIDRCNCKFLWCCNVICEECQRTVERNICL